MSEREKRSMALNSSPVSDTPRSHKSGQSKRKPPDSFDGETSRGSDDLPCKTEEKIQRVVREELKLLKSDLKKVRKEQKHIKSHFADLVGRY